MENSVLICTLLEDPTKLHTRAEFFISLCYADGMLNATVTAEANFLISVDSLYVDFLSDN